MAPFAHHNGVLSSNFGRDSDLEIRFADEDDRFRDKPRGYYEEHEQKLLSGPEPERTTFQPETRIAIDPTTTQDEVTGPSCPSSPQPYEMTEEGFPTISPENSQLWKICECNADLIETFATVMEEIQDLIEIPDGEEHATGKQQLEEEMREWQAMREEEARKDEEVRRLISEWEEHNKRKEEEIRRWTNTAQETLEKQADREEAHKMTREKKGKMKTCYVSLGSAHGVAEGTFLDVKSVVNKAGREVYEDIGVLKIEKILAEDLSECSVVSNGKELLEAIKQYIMKKTTDEKNAKPLLVNSRCDTGNLIKDLIHIFK